MHPFATVEHSYNCMVLLCRAPFGVSGRYTKITNEVYNDAVSFPESSLKGILIAYKPKNGYVTVFLSTASAVSVTTGIQYTLCTLPAKYRPIRDVFVRESEGRGYFKVTTDGRVLLVPNVSNLWFYSNLTYPI